MDSNISSFNWLFVGAADGLEGTSGITVGLLDSISVFKIEGNVGLYDWNDEGFAVVDSIVGCTDGLRLGKSIGCVVVSTSPFIGVLEKVSSEFVVADGAPVGLSCPSLRDVLFVPIEKCDTSETLSSSRTFLDQTLHS